MENAYSDREKRVRRVFRVGFELIDRYKGGVEDGDWPDIHRWHEGKLDASDPLAAAVLIACIDELERQYREGKKRRETTAACAKTAAGD